MASALRAAVRTPRSTPGAALTRSHRTPYIQTVVNRIAGTKPAWVIAFAAGMSRVPIHTLASPSLRTWSTIPLTIALKKPFCR